jgi:hypothetical protein
MTADERFVDVTYRGLRAAAHARWTETGPATGFVEAEAPLPVGTMVQLSGDVTLEARVTGVVEQEAGAKGPAGMRLSWGAPVPGVPDPGAPEPAAGGDDTSGAASDGRRRRQRRTKTQTGRS